MMTTRGVRRVGGTTAVLSAVLAAGGLALASGRGSVPACAGTSLGGAIIDVQGAAGSSFGRLILINTSSRSCRLRGFISGAFVGIDGRPIATHTSRDHGDPVRTVVVKPGAAAAATLRWSNIPSESSTSCERA